MIKKMDANLLVEDFNLYPRSKVDSSVVLEIIESISAGRTIPPVIVDKKSLRIVDGFHRRRAILKLYKDNPLIECELKEYDTENDLYLDAVRYNRGRGKDITGSELTGAILKGLELKIEPAALANCIGVTVERINNIVSMKATNIEHKNILIALKGSVRHMRGIAVSNKQAKVIESASGTPQWLLISQVSDLIENNLIDYNNKKVVYELKRLKQLIKSD